MESSNVTARYWRLLGPGYLPILSGAGSAPHPGAPSSSWGSRSEPPDPILREAPENKGDIHTILGPTIRGNDETSNVTGDLSTYDPAAGAFLLLALREQ
ncbi:hypothetical protein Moror_2752 [Moniliophthora roreri MCA 2997]|uniref:Uncharacterized protein n=2 Tax=Moniliophthora roreri TaxID=221103 RepID=V2XFW9_MONRO|nr:hypothetical protein Moror_2752 [Moniliophthora roreri MCA 2997]